MSSSKVDENFVKAINSYILVTDNEATYGTYQKKHEENFLKIAENRLRKTIPNDADLP